MVNIFDGWLKKEDKLTLKLCLQQHMFEKHILLFPFLKMISISDFLK